MSRTIRRKGSSNIHGIFTRSEDVRKKDGIADKLYHTDKLKLKNYRREDTRKPKEPLLTEEEIAHYNSLYDE